LLSHRVASVDSDRRNLTQLLMSRVERPDSSKSFGLYYISSMSDFAPLSRFVERSVFSRQFGNDDREMEQEYGPFENSSFFITVVDHVRAEPVGVIRVIENSDAGLKTLLDIEREPAWGTTVQDFLDRHCGSDGLSRVLDVASLAVRPEWGSSQSGALVAVALYGGMFRSALATRARRVVAAIDEAVADLLRAVEVPLEPVCGLPAIEYLGSPDTRPYLIQFDEINALMSRSPLLMGVMMGGAVDEEISLPPIDLDNPNLHPTEIEPQFITDPAPVEPEVAASLD